MSERTKRGEVPKMFVEAEESDVPTFELVSYPVLHRDKLTGELLVHEIVDELKSGKTIDEALKGKHGRSIRFVEVTEEET